MPNLRIKVSVTLLLLMSVASFPHVGHISAEIASFRYIDSIPDIAPLQRIGYLLEFALFRSVRYRPEVHHIIALFVFLRLDCFIEFAIFRRLIAPLNSPYLGVLEWVPPGQTIEDCLMKGKKSHNYIRVMVRQSNGRNLICGTHAYSPKCREYVYSNNDRMMQQRRQFDGQAIVPYDPKHNSTAVYIADTNEIYTGTVSDFAGNDPLIYRKRLSDDEGLRTQRDDLKVLDSPNFVASFVYGEHVYFWYREWAAEVSDGDRQIYARVARVCKNDRGGARPAHERWTSYVKARLNCSIPANTPFYFNELQAVTEPIATADGSSPHESMPIPRPGSCVTDSSKLSENIVSFIARNPLMHEAVPAVRSRPILVQGPERAPFSQIAVSSKVWTVHNALYVGTLDGRVLKLYDLQDGPTIIVQSVKVFSKNSPIINLMANSEQLIVVSSDEVAAIPLEYCSEQRNCAGCVHLQDAHCAWDLNSARCIGRSTWSGENFVQNIILGQSEQCPEGAIDPNYYTIDELQSERITSPDEKPNNFGNERFFIAILITMAIASISGFFIGYRFSRWRLIQDGQQHSSTSSTGSYDSYGRARLTRHDSLAGAKLEHVYGIGSGKDTVSLVSGIPQNGTPFLNQCSNINSGFMTPKLSNVIAFLHMQVIDFRYFTTNKLRLSIFEYHQFAIPINRPDEVHRSNICRGGSTDWYLL
ncbi:Semaphorin-1A [Dirofilaria immitis]|nr:Semaphorin-1A [Dirofilaria immitis]